MAKRTYRLLSLVVAMFTLRVLRRGDARLLGNFERRSGAFGRPLSRAGSSMVVRITITRTSEERSIDKGFDCTKGERDRQMVKTRSIFGFAGKTRSHLGLPFIFTQRRLLQSSTTNKGREFHFWLRGGSSEEESVATTDVSRKRPFVDILVGDFPISVCSVQGYRDYMEDEFVSAADFCAVFDGHGGKAVSRYLRQNLYANLQAALPMVLAARPDFSEAVEVTNDATCSNSTHHDDDELLIRNNPETPLGDPKNNATAAFSPKSNNGGGVPTVADYESALEIALDKVDREVQRISHWSYQGSTAVAVWIHQEGESKTAPDGDDASEEDGEPSDIPPPPQRTLITANVGDSRAVLCRNGTAIELTRDHKPNDPLERSRIHKLGGQVFWHGEIDTRGEPVAGTGIYRVNGNLALSRAIGDRSERPAVTADPEISVVPLTDADEFVVVATDGLWDVMSSSDTVAYILALIDNSRDDDTIDKETIAGLLVEEALRRGSYDNITVVIIWMNVKGPRCQKKWWI